MPRVVGILVCLVAVAVAAAGCGFRPLYLADNSGRSVIDDLGQIEIAPIADRRGQMLRNELVERLNPAGPPAQPAYLLQTNLRERIRELASRIDDSATRANLILTANFRLIDRTTNSALLSGEIESSVNYSISISDLATLAAERDARKRGARDIAERMSLQIGAFLTAPSDEAARRSPAVGAGIVAAHR